MKEYTSKECVFHPMDLDCLILNPAFINKRPAGGVYKKQVPAAYKRVAKRDKSTSDDGAILKFAIAAVAVFALALFI